MAPVTEIDAGGARTPPMLGSPGVAPAVPPHGKSTSSFTQQQQQHQQQQQQQQQKQQQQNPRSANSATPPSSLPPIDPSALEAPLSTYVYNILACQLCSAGGPLTTGAGSTALPVDKGQKDNVNSSKTLTAQPGGPLASDGENKSYKQNGGRTGSESGGDTSGDNNAANTNNKNQGLSGVAFDIVLKPASSPSPPKSKALSPMWSREAPLDNRVDNAGSGGVGGVADVEMRSGAGMRRSRPISAEIIDCKLKAAEERRMNLELDKLTSLAEQRDRAREAVARMLEDHETWSRAAAERHLAKMEMIEGNRMEQLAALQERLREHEQHIENVRKASEFYAQMLEAKVAKKLEEAEQKREEQKREKLEKLAEHDRHCEEVRRNKERLEETRQNSPLEIPIKTSQEVSG